ncbi:hypothetical protein [Actinomadura chibensis]|uniref:Peptidase inhibitor family I36 protein n=1 Tax=Actinomadura chibensis TaxID=392828 RepID=A0A5D0NPA6_9ACTN|nr:hypothetical protein [Actinomadura chibensis]TYB46356.1 hypothetical protein FXF69_13900 [Actinomadura chibensis]
MASTGATAAHAAAFAEGSDHRAIAGTGACTTGRFCLWGDRNYDPPLVARIPPVPGGQYVVLEYAAFSGYNATNQGQYVYEAYDANDCAGARAYIPPYTHFRDITTSGLDRISCVTHS